MQLPALQGTFDQQDFFIYAACDHQYFKDFGTSFVNSIKKNTVHSIHIHLFNPEPDQIAYCQRNGVGVTWEHAHSTLFAESAQKWQTVPVQEPEKSRYERTLNAMTKGRDSGILDRMQKTYYACARFVRLAELYRGPGVFAVDIDAVVRSGLPTPGIDKDFYIHHISGKRSRYLAGGLWLKGSDTACSFLSEYAAQLRDWFARDYVYWGLDQDVLDVVVPRYPHGQLSMDYIDWNMRPNSHIWTAKGTRKELSVFVNEQQRYTV